MSIANEEQLPRRWLALASAVLAETAPDDGVDVRRPVGRDARDCEVRLARVMKRKNLPHAGAAGVAQRPRRHFTLLPIVGETP